MGLTLMSCSDSFTDPNDPKFDDNNGQNSVNADITLTVDASDGVDINPQIFGVNNDWRQIPDGTFSNFVNSIEDIDYSVLRYPGGWESEFYAWTSNSTPGWNNTPPDPGASVSTLKSKVSNYSIVIPTAEAMNTSVGTSQWNIAIANLKTRAEVAINTSDIGAGIVEIGNEWWLQYAGGVSKEQKLEKYVQVAMELAEHIDDTYPNHSFKLLVNGDYTQPQEFTTMKNLFTKAYDVIDGVALHTYTGYVTNTHDIADLEDRIIACTNNFNSNKDFIYLSEWMPSRLYNETALYMEAANIIPDIIHIYARAGADAAAYWPPINTSIPGLGLTNWNYTTVYPVGQIFGELARSYTGKALKTTSDKFHLSAARPDQNTIVLFVTGGQESGKKVAIRVSAFTVSSIEKAERYIPSDYNDPAKAEPYVKENATSDVEISTDNEVIIDVNKDGLYEIYKIVIKGN
jgi:hypothetical protein